MRALPAALVHRLPHCPQSCSRFGKQSVHVPTLDVPPGRVDMWGLAVPHELRAGISVSVRKAMGFW